MNVSEKLEVALIQSDLVWENPIENRNRFQEKIDRLSPTVDLVILPEMFTTGFTMNAIDFAEKMNGETVFWMQNMARKHNIALVGSIIITEDNTFYNRLLFVHPSEKIEVYDKRHTFTLAGEDKIFSAGKKKLIVSYKGWRICPLICYDLRFPVWSRNTENYDLLIYVASWPKPRINAWNTLLKSRAIENMCYTLGVNRVGIDINDYAYTGNSAIVDSLGELLSEVNEHECVHIKTLEKNHLEKSRTKLGFLKDKDDFLIQ